MEHPEHGTRRRGAGWDCSLVAVCAGSGLGSARWKERGCRHSFAIRTHSHEPCTAAEGCQKLAGRFGHDGTVWIVWCVLTAADESRHTCHDS